MPEPCPSLSATSPGILAMGNRTGYTPLQLANYEAGDLMFCCQKSYDAALERMKGH